MVVPVTSTDQHEIVFPQVAKYGAGKASRV